MDIDPRRLPFLLSVAREGGIVAAADILMVSPSAVSQQIQKLEEEVGLKLVERTTSGAILTPAGTIVAEAGERINSNIAEALKALRPLTGQVTGTVTLGAFLTICRSTLIPALPDLTDALPGIDLRIEETEETPGMARATSTSSSSSATRIRVWPRAVTRTFRSSTSRGCSSPPTPLPRFAQSRTWRT